MSKCFFTFSVLCLFFVVSVAPLTAAHTWKTTSGHKAVGDFVEIDADNNVVIELDDGDLTKVPFGKFVKEDQSFAKKKQKEKEKQEKEEGAEEAGNDSEEHDSASSAKTTKKSSANSKPSVDDIEKQLAKDIEDAENKVKDAKLRIKKISGLKDKAGDNILKQSKLPEERMIGYRHKIEAIEDLGEQEDSARNTRDIRDKKSKLQKEIKKDKNLKEHDQDELLDELNPQSQDSNQPANNSDGM